MKTTLAASPSQPLSNELTHVAICVKLTAQDGTVVGITNADQDVVLSGVTYAGQRGHTPSTFQQQGGLAVDNLEATLILDETIFKRDDILNGKWDHANALVQLVVLHDNGTAPDVFVLQRARLGNCTASRDAMQVELRGLMDAYANRIVEIYSPGCRADLGDARCGVDIESYRVSGTVTSVTSGTDARMFVDTNRTEGTNYFAGGIVTWVTGNNAGRSMEIKSNDNVLAQVILVSPMYLPIQAGDTYTAIPGCMKSIDVCATKFNNVVNFRGEPFVPLDSGIFFAGTIYTSRSQGAKK
jgi:uncharacterized phage protein (TIGR02218 family)